MSGRYQLETSSLGRDIEQGRASRLGTRKWERVRGKQEIGCSGLSGVLAAENASVLDLARHSFPFYISDLIVCCPVW